MSFDYHKADFSYTFDLPEAGTYVVCKHSNRVLLVDDIDEDGGFYFGIRTDGTSDVYVWDWRPATVVEIMRWRAGLQ